MPSFPILTYHSQIFQDNSYAGNNHVALARDLEMIYSLGLHVKPLSSLAGWMSGEISSIELEGAVFLTFDDGCNFDVQNLDHPEFGFQVSFRSILKDFANTLGPERAAGLHATTFVIASEAARQALDAGSLFGKNWISSDWWRETDREGLIAIESHGWDHNHPDLGGDARGGFEHIDSEDLCRTQVIHAAETIGGITGRRPAFFAYPYGQSSAYMRDEWFPRYRAEHGCKAAFGTEPCHVSLESNRWNLPRYICGHHWRSPGELRNILQIG